MYVLPRGADPRTTEGMLLDGTDPDLVPERIFHFYRASFQIALAFRDAKQHLGLNDGQTRSRDKLHFHFNTVFAAHFWARLQAWLQAEGSLGPFSLHNLKRHNFEEEIQQRITVWSAVGRNAANAKASHHHIPPPRATSSPRRVPRRAC